MLVAVVFSLQPVGEARLPRSHGHFAYTAALDLFLRVDPALSRHLHEAVPKPLTVGPLTGPFRPEGPHWVLRPEALYRWRLTGLTPDVAEGLLRLAGRAEAVRIGPALFRTTAVATTTEEHPEAGRDSYEGLAGRWPSAPPPTAVILEFQTPTTFRVGRYERPFPVPELVFGSLLDVWNAFAPEPLGEWRDLWPEVVVLSNWRGETRRVELGNYRTVGFIGRCTFRVPAPIPEVRRLIGLLAEFAFYAGVGWQRTHGLGQVRPHILGTRSVANRGTYS